VFLHAHPHPRAWVAAKWTDFKHLSAETGTSHLSSLGSNRYDFWRVALREFHAHPLAGIGSRGFRLAYLQNRRSAETPARSHSVELDALSETGIVGFLLLAAALGLVAAAVGRRARSDLVAVGALGAFACWLGQASVDWTWSFPAVGLPLFALVGIGAAHGAPPLRRRAALPLAACAAALAVGAFGLPWLAARYVDTALAHPADAAADLRHAHALDPLSLDPYEARWALAPTPRAGIAPLRAALRQEPRSVDLLVMLGRQYRLAGDRAAARRLLREALARDPRDPTVLTELRAAH
jgi:O-antigen ligase/polysaccharide polymerase Wzy-like membrane protein/tetratricopeptide repeat protein